MSCEENAKTVLRQEYLDALTAAKSMFQCCPKCKKPWEVPQHCQHVKCDPNYDGCSMEFCYLCAAPRSVGI